MARGVLDVYHSIIESQECKHQKKVKTENGFEWVSTWYKYWVDRYAGRIEKCTLCKQKRVLDTKGDGPIGWIEQASLF